MKIGTRIRMRIEIDMGIDMWDGYGNGDDILFR